MAEEEEPKIPQWFNEDMKIFLSIFMTSERMQVLENLIHVIKLLKSTLPILYGRVAVAQSFGMGSNKREEIDTLSWPDDFPANSHLRTLSVGQMFEEYITAHKALRAEHAADGFADLREFLNSKRTAVLEAANQQSVR